MEACREFALPLSLPEYSELYCHFDRERSALWYYLNQSRPCSTRVLIDEVHDLQARVAAYLKSSQQARDSLHYLVCASATPQVFNLGGDLELFIRLINERDHTGLYDYGQRCVDAIYHNWTNLGVPTLATISLVQGTALGGGFEGALSSNVLIAEESAQMGFPEILFNLFPGMGAYSLLVRRIEPWRAERLLRTARQYPARELWEMGIVDLVVPDGEGVHAVNDFIRRRQHTRNGHQAIHQVRQRINPLTREELLGVIEIWVETAMRLSPRDLRVMARIAEAQQQRTLADQQPEKASPVTNVQPIMPAAVWQSAV